jgi:hypothetical protein
MNTRCPQLIIETDE